MSLQYQYSIWRSNLFKLNLKNRAQPLQLFQFQVQVDCVPLSTCFFDSDEPLPRTNSTARFIREFWKGRDAYQGREFSSLSPFPFSAISFSRVRLLLRAMEYRRKFSTASFRDAGKQFCPPCRSSSLVKRDAFLSPRFLRSK